MPTRRTREVSVSLERLSVSDTEFGGLSYPAPSDSDAVKKEKMKKIQEKVTVQIGDILNQVQNVEENNKKELDRLYKKVEFVYERVATVTDDRDIVRIYKNAVVNCIWSFGAVVWKLNGVSAVSSFMTRCFAKLGAKNHPAAHFVIRLFVKYNSDLNEKTRLSELQCIYALLDSDLPEFPRRLHDTALKTLMIRLKDRCSKCRVQTVLILQRLLPLDDTNVIIKELKYFTRYDVNVEVRRVGTSVLANTSMKLRFFYDQAFDKSVAVRFQAFKGFISRDMAQIQSDKVCKALLWGLCFSEKRCGDYVKNELLKTWVGNCGNKLPVFLAKLDAYANMKLVIRIVDIMVTNPDIKDALDMSFVDEVKNHILEKEYRSVSIEGMVAWLCVCKHGMVVPEANEILNVVKLLHHAVFLESNQAVIQQRNEDVTPVISITIALHIASFAIFEEAVRRELVNVLRKILLDPLLDERPLITQAVMSLYKADPILYEDVMLSAFEELFDPDNNPKLTKQNQKHDSFQIVKLRETLCTVSLERLELANRREEYVRDKKYLEVIPITEKLKELAIQEASIKAKLTKIESTKPSVITSVEQGLSKALVMINTHLDIVPVMNPFIRNIYDNYVPVFLKEPDVSTRISVLKFLTKIALIEKAQVKKVMCLLLRVLLQNSDPELKSTSYMCVVDLLVFYEYKDFLMSQDELDQDPALHPYIADYDEFLSQLLPKSGGYVDCTEAEMEAFVNETLNSYKSTEKGLKYQGLLKMLIRGKLKDTSTISSLLSLWVNHDYVGTCVLRDLEHVLKLWDTFTWWDSSHNQTLTTAFTSAVIHLSTLTTHDVLIKFVSYIITFINISSEDCMSSIMTPLLDYIYEKPCSSNVQDLMKVCSTLPVGSDSQATAVVEYLHRISSRVTDYPQTNSIKELKQSALAFVRKLHKCFNIDNPHSPESE